MSGVELDRGFEVYVSYDEPTVIVLEDNAGETCELSPTDAWELANDLLIAIRRAEGVES